MDLREIPTERLREAGEWHKREGSRYANEIMQTDYAIAAACIEAEIERREARPA